MDQPISCAEVRLCDKHTTDSFAGGRFKITACLAFAVMLASLMFSGCAGVVGGQSAAQITSHSGTVTLAVSPTSISFTDVAVGTTAKQIVTVTNSDTVSENLTTVTASGTAFCVTGITLPYALAAGSNTTFTAEFTPSSTASETGSISIAATSGNSDPTATIALSGTATQAQISLSQSSVSFGPVVVGQSNSQLIAIFNSGSAPLTVSAYTVTGAGFSTSGLTTPLAIQPGKSSSFNVIFDPSAASASSGSVSLSSNAPNSPATLTLTGSGSAATYSLSVSPSTVAFGSLALNASSSQTVSMKNIGNSNITVSSVSVTGAGFADSGVSANSVLSPDQNVSLNVTFDPSTPGAASGKVTIVSNAANSPESVSLSGTGTPSHSVSLVWTASSSPSIVGYNVYRGTTSGTYSRVNSSPVSTTSYTDSTVQSGQSLTYYYVVTAVDSSGAESTDSNQATALVP